MFKPDATRFLFLIFLVALLIGRGTFALLLGLVLLVMVVAQGWSKLALRGFVYQRTFSPARAFVGDTVELRIELRNRKLLGVPGLRVQDPVPTRLHVQGARLVPSPHTSMQYLERRTSLRPYEAVTWTYQVHCDRRGYYSVGPVVLEASDPWGLNTTEVVLPGKATLAVYPQLLALDELNLDPRHPLGELRAARQLHTDPARTIGIRDYERGDPFKAIHWGATARRGQLQTRVYEPTTSLELAIVLDLDTFEQYWEGLQIELTERMISAAATVATAANRDRWSFGLYANGVAADSEEIVRVAPGRSPAHLPLVMETLAKLVPYSVAPMSQLIRRLGPLLPWGTSVLLISAVGSQPMQQALLRLAERGRRVLWLYAGPGAPPVVPGVVVRPLADREAWSKSEQGSSGLRAGAERPRLVRVE